jgi:hypothetical protein
MRAAVSVLGGLQATNAKQARARSKSAAEQLNLERGLELKT